MDAILLAAGNSIRFGENKLLYEIDGIPMYRYALELLYQSYKKNLLEHIIVVTQYAEIEHQIHCNYPEVTIVKNDAPQKGISRSVRLGLHALAKIAPMSEGCLFMVGDQPLLRSGTLENLIRTWHGSERNIAACGKGERIGNPVIFGKQYYSELEGLSGDMGGKKVVKRHMEDVCICETDEAEMEDADVKSFFTQPKRTIGRDGIF